VYLMLQCRFSRAATDNILTRFPRFVKE